MRIGIIGAGQIGGTLTRRLTALGHEVFVANSRGAETLSDLAAETGTTAVSVPEAVRGVDLVVVTIPEKNIPSLPAGLFANTPDHVVVVDTGNYYPRQRDGRIESIEAGLPEREQRPPLPPSTAVEKVRKAEDAWNTRDPLTSPLHIRPTASGGTAASFLWAVRPSWLSSRANGTASSTIG